MLLAGLDDVVHFGKAFTRYEETPDGRIVAHFEDGTSAEGDVLVAASREFDRADFLLLPIEDERGDKLNVRGRLLRDWVGLAELQIQVDGPNGWQPALTVMPLQIAAGKIAQEEFEALCEEVAGHSAAALLDVYGKTFFGLEMEYRKGEHAPVAALHRVRQAIDQLSVSLREIATQPAVGVRPARAR